MSGYLEVKYPCKTNIGLKSFKSWKRQWCILRPSPTRAGGGALAVYCSEAGAAAGCVELPPGCLVRRAKSRSRPHAFAVFDNTKPQVLLAAPTAQEAQLWMDKIRALLQGNKISSETLLKDSYSVTVVDTELSRKCGLSRDGTVALTSKGVVISLKTRDQRILVQWSHVKGASLSDDKTICAIHIDGDFPHGCGSLRVSSPLACELAGALRARAEGPGGPRGHGTRAPSRSHPDLTAAGRDTGEVRRSSWNSEPSEVSLDDTDLLMSKESKRIPSGRLSRCGARDLGPNSAAAAILKANSVTSFDDSFDRRSLVSLASGIYEEIADAPAPRERAGCPAACELKSLEERNNAQGTKTVSHTEGPQSSYLCRLEEPTYESVAECRSGRASATLPRPRYLPPPLPPRVPFGTTKLGESWNSRLNASPQVTRHSSLHSLPRSHRHTDTHAHAYNTKTLPKEKTKQTFSVFRKRLKSDSTVHTSPKSDPTKENTETKKKRFDFTPTKDIFKNFKVGRKMKGLKLGLTKIGETKSCEFLDETEHVSTKRCSKSVENLDGDSDFVDDLDEVDLSIDSSDDIADSLTLPEDILKLILKNREIMKTNLAEDDYMPMSPIVAPVPEQHYIVMSPRGNIA